MFLFQVEGRKRESKLNFIRENWQRMNDEEMAKHLQCSRVGVGLRRLKLGLKRKRGGGGKTRKNSFKSKVSRHYLEEALNKEGKTMVEIAREFGVSRERVRQVCKEWEITVRRTPQWYANRIGIPELADKKWFERELKRASGVRHLSREIGISSSLIQEQAKRLGIDSLKVWYAKTIEITCEICGKEKERRQSDIKRNKHSFCSKVCQGKWLAKHSKRLWTLKEEDFIRLNYKKMSDPEIAEKLGRTLPAVRRRRAEKLQLKRRRGLRKKNRIAVAHYVLAKVDAQENRADPIFF